ncbi:MAG: gliding motility-associated C-terminal domain-containing protein [Bacteroidia bacterium]|nr:gliding motility-associated C-terminal domain-containing protein [Bacteroidia bacterium]
MYSGGKKIYEWTYKHGDDITKNKWDGKINGNAAAPGIYFYIIEATGIDDVEHEVKKGTVTLIRDK